MLSVEENKSEREKKEGTLFHNVFHYIAAIIHSHFKNT